MTNVKDTLRAYIAEHFDAGDDPDFTDEVNLFDFGFVDSLGATEILLYIVVFGINCFVCNIP